MAKTEEGKLTRAYFIDAEKKWKITQQIALQVASEVEIMHLKIELAKIEAQKAMAECQKVQAEIAKFAISAFRLYCNGITF